MYIWKVEALEKGRLITREVMANSYKAAKDIAIASGWEFINASICRACK